MCSSRFYLAVQCLAKAGLASCDSCLRPQFHCVPSQADPYDDVGRALLVPASEWNRTVAACQPRSALQELELEGCLSEPEML